MNRAFTTREKVMLVILVVLIMAIGYFKLLLEPINAKIQDFQTQQSSEQDEILINSSLVQQKRQMEKELEELFANGDPTPIPVYDNSANLLVELHKILDSSAEYTLNFSGTSPMDVEYLIRRPVSLTFRTASYGQARNIINQLHDSENTNAISDLSVTFSGNTNEILYWNQLDGNDEDYPISVSMTITYYERLENK